MRFLTGALSVLFLINPLLLSQDSTATLVGPGFKYHSVYKLAGGPFNIKILEIDLSKPANKIKTVLARDVLGSGFEKTSTMASRNDRSGNIVIGAVNGDFFGISDATRVSTFLTGSQITAKEFAQGHIAKKASFALRAPNKPIFDDIGFSGTVTSKSDSVFTISGLNDTVKTNYLVLHNKYIGGATKTISGVSEVKLQPLSVFTLNSTMKFKVIAKQSGTGNMAFHPAEYVLSGNGTARAYLDTLVQVGDTLRVRIGTSPSRGDVNELISGGPRLITNGTVNSGLDANVHPRTAVGINQDSTKVYFLTVDGRQPGFSVGMSLPQLADYMLSIGCYQALNLDGGGSTTMVVRGAIVNRPSDASGERSVGNALLAVLETPSREITAQLKLNPETIFMDSTQTKKLNVAGIDTWGYPVQLNPTDLIWQVSGIQGIVDTLGYFHPHSVGTGKIIGRLNALSDTIDVTVTGTIIPVWSLCDAGNNLRSWFSPTGSTERGMAYSKRRKHLYVVNRPNLSILNPANGDLIGTLNQSGVSGGTYTLNDVDVSDDDVIVAANLTISAASPSFKVYKWVSETDLPQVVLEYSGAAYRLGDKITVAGSFSDSSAILYAAANASNKVLKWTMAGGVFNPVPTEITLSGITSYGTCPSIAPKGLGSANFYINANSITPKEFTQSGTLVGTVPSSLVDGRSNAIRYFEEAGRKFILTFQYGFPNENAKLLDVSKGADSAKLVETTPSLGDNANTVGASGDIAWRHYAGDIYILYVLSTNNGIGAHQVTLERATGTETGVGKISSYVLKQNFPNPFNPSTTIQYSLPATGLVTVWVYDVLGRRMELLVNEEKAAGQHTVEYNASALPSGTYFYEIRVNGYRDVKKCLLLK